MGVFLDNQKAKLRRYTSLFLICFISIISMNSIAFASSVDKSDQVSTALGAHVSTQKVYDNPDDHDLNLRYALQQMKLGEMLNAGAALERMLYANPDWHSARLLYAGVLYRLDDQKAALRELSLLEGKNLNLHQIETLGRYKTEFAQAPEKVFQSGTGVHFSRGFNPRDLVQLNIMLGARADDNAGNALVDAGFGLSDRGDVSVVAEADLSVTKPINAQESTTFQAGIRVQSRRHETFSDANFDVVDLRAGFTTKPNKSRASVHIDARRINISGEKYLEQVGPRATLSSRLNDTTRITFSAAAYAQDYQPVLTARLEDERDGVKVSFQAGILKKISDRNKISASIGYEKKSADLSAFAYTGNVINASFQHTFDNESYLRSEARYRNLDFKGSLDSRFDSREDDRIYLRQAIGTPLKLFMKSDEIKTASVELGVNYISRNSNIERNDYENIGVDLRVKVKL